MKLRFQVLATTFSKTTKHISVFVLGIVMARMLPVEIYGTYLQVQLVVNTLLYAAIFGIPHSIYYFLPRVRLKRRFILSTAMLMFVLATTVSLATYFAMPWISEKLNNADLTAFALIVALLLFFQIPIKIFEPAMISLQKVPLFVVVNATFNVSFLFVVLAPLLLGFDLYELLLVIVGFYVVQFVVIAIALAHSAYSAVDDDDGEDHQLAEQLKFSVPIGFSGVIGEVASQVDKVIVSMFFGPYQYAIYTRGALQIPLLNVISHSLHNILMPNFVKAVKDNDTPALLKAWHGAMRLMAFFVYPTFVFFVATADLFIPALYSDKYAEASVIFQVYMFTLLRRITSPDAIIRAIGKTSILLKMSAFSIILNVSLTYYLISRLGVIGAPLATVLMTYTVFGIYLIVVGRMLNVPLRSLVPWASLVQFLMISAIAIVVASLLRLVDLPRIGLLLCIGVVFGVIYLALLRKSTALEETEKTALRGVLPRQLRWAI